MITDVRVTLVTVHSVISSLIWRTPTGKCYCFGTLLIYLLSCSPPRHRYEPSNCFCSRKL